MSMNVRLGTKTCHCDAIKQTPTEATYAIVKSDDPMEAYFAWLRSRMDEWHEQDMKNERENPDPDFDQDFQSTYWDNEYQRQTKAIRAYVETHPDAGWTAS